MGPSPPFIPHCIGSGFARRRNEFGTGTTSSLPIVVAPSIVEYVEAVYPEHALAEGKEATVRLQINLDETGAVQDVQVIEPVGDGFDEAAVAAVQQMTFSPAETQEGPVPVVFEFAYGFVLNEAPAPAEDVPPPINFEGLLREMGTKNPIEDAQIVILGSEASATTDATGAFAFRGLPNGPVDIRILHPKYVTLTETIEIVDGEVTTAKLWLRNLQYRENEVTALYRPVKKEVTRRTLSINEVKRIPGTFGDPVKVIQTLPGAARSPFGTGLLLIRGANPETRVSTSTAFEFQSFITSLGQHPSYSQTSLTARTICPVDTADNMAVQWAVSLISKRNEKSMKRNLRSEVTSLTAKCFSKLI